MDPKMIYKLMVDNNPDEAIKQLVYFDKKIIDQDIERDMLKNQVEKMRTYVKRVKEENERLNNIIIKATEYLKTTPKVVNDSLHKRDKDTSFVFINTKIKLDLLDILEGE